MFPDRFNLADYLLEHNLRDGRADKVALRWRDEEHTYAGLAEASSRLAHAFMLTGVRGVGKTTTARIIARALLTPSFFTSPFSVAAVGGFSR